MLLPLWFRYALIGVGLLAVIVAFQVWKHRRESARDQRIPEANVVDKSVVGPLVRRWWPAVAAVLGLLLAYWAYQHKYEHLIVEDGSSGPEVRRRWGADKDFAGALAPGQKQPSSDTWGSDPTWVVNRSSRTVRVETVRYGRSLGFSNEPDVIPPGTAAHFSEIEHVGPNDPPPSQVRDDIKLGMAFRHWLTWDVAWN